MSVETAVYNACGLKDGVEFSIKSRDQDFAELGKDWYSEMGILHLSSSDIDELFLALENDSTYEKSELGKYTMFDRGETKIDRCTAKCEINIENSIVKYSLYCS